MVRNQREALWNNSAQAAQNSGVVLQNSLKTDDAIIKYQAAISLAAGIVHRR